MWYQAYDAMPKTCYVLHTLYHANNAVPDSCYKILACQSLQSIFEAYKGDYTVLFPEKVIDHNGKPSCIFQVADTITKHNPSGELITMDIKTFACVSHVPSFGRHIPVGPSGTWLSAVYDCHDLAEHTVIAGFQFNPGGYLPWGFVFDPGGSIFHPGGFMQLLKSIWTVCDVMNGHGEQSMKYFMCDASDKHIVGIDGHTGCLVSFQTKGEF